MNLNDFVSRLEDRRARRTGPSAMTDIPCAECGQPLIASEFVLGVRRLCDNHECCLFREGQGIELKEPIKSRGPSYQRKLADKRRRRRELYDFAMSLGISSYRANRLRDTCRAHIEDYAKHDN